MIRLFSYKMTHDTGFAPNPFHGFLTLATCKPLIRKHKKVGDWIAGFTSKVLNSDEVGNERLVYLMKVTNKVSICEYWREPMYKYKKFIKDKNDVHFYGDNIYELIENGDFMQHNNSSHDAGDIRRDLSGEFALISNHFYYFGKNALSIPESIRPKTPKTQSAHGVRTYDKNKVDEFLNHIERKYKIGIHGEPICWKRSLKLDKNESCSKQKRV